MSNVFIWPGRSILGPIIRTILLLLLREQDLPTLRFCHLGSIPSYLVLLPSWIHPVIPCASAILDPSHHTLRFCHLGSIPSYLALLPSWIHPIIPCTSAILDPSHHTLRFCHLGSIPSYLALLPSWIHPTIPCASAILDPSHHTLSFCHRGSIPSYLALLPSWIHPIMPCASAILDPSHHVHVVSSHSNSLLFRRWLLHINIFFTSCRSHLSCTGKALYSRGGELASTRGGKTQHPLANASIVRLLSLLVSHAENILLSFSVCLNGFIGFSKVV